MQEYRNIKTFLQKVMFYIGQKKLLWLKNVKNIVPWMYVISDLNGEKIVGTFYKKRTAQKKKKKNQKGLRVKGDVC